MAGPTGPGSKPGLLTEAGLQAIIGTAKADAARAFYADTLGLELIGDDMFALLFKIGGGVLRIAKMPAYAPSPHAVLGFEVSDIEATRTALVAEGVALERFPFIPQDANGVWTAPDGMKVAWFRDPDLNLLSIMQRG
jgi:catechol 2,3-dioxygenase-like lactoylglutathione lyase family enzyme